jgi:hypothetical protein
MCFCETLNQETDVMKKFNTLTRLAVSISKQVDLDLIAEVSRVLISLLAAVQCFLATDA